MIDFSKIKNFILEQTKIIWDKNKNINPSIINVYHEYEITTSEIMEKCNTRFQEVEHALQDLREGGYIYDYKFISRPTGRICKIQPSKDFLFLYNVLKENNKKSEINTIECVELNNNKYYLVLNKDYLNELEVDRNIKCWDFFWKIIKEDYLPNNKKNKEFLTYFNSNIGNKIYTDTGYQKTKILKIEGNRIYPNIKIETISKKAFETRKNKAKKT